MKRVLLLICVAWLAGLASGVVSRGWYISLLLAALFFGWGLYSRGRVAFLVALSGVVVLGAVWGSVAVTRGIQECSVASVTSPVTGIIRERHRVYESTAVYYVAADNDCVVMVVVPRWPLLSPGDTVTVAGKFESAASMAREAPGYARYLASQRIVGRLSYGAVLSVSENRSFTQLLHTGVRQNIQKILPEPDASFVTAMILAEEGTLPEVIQHQFRATGTTHLLAISGLNISLMAGMFVVALLFFPVRGWLRTGIVLLLVWVYIVLIGLPVSAVRAAWFWTFLLLGSNLGMLLSLPTIIFLTSVVMATLNPWLFYDVGFQLSLSAVIGIGLTLFLLKPYTRTTWLTVLTALAGATIGATLMTWPIILYSFGNISFISLVANVLLEPAFPLLLVVSLLTIGLGWLWEPLALVGSFIVHLLYRYFEIVTGFLSRLPGSFLEEVSFPQWAVIAYYTLIFIACIVTIRLQKRSWREVWE